MKSRLQLFRNLTLALSLCGLITACDVHEMPDIPENEPFVIRLNFDTDMTPWHHTVKKTEVAEMSLGDPAPSMSDNGIMRYVVRVYPLQNGREVSPQQCVKEFVYEKSVYDGYDNTLTAALPSGDYKVMVWADMREISSGTPFYFTDNFVEMTLQGEHHGNTDLRDAFRGSADISLAASIAVHTPDTVDVTMQRPLAKYEFISTDLKEFIDKEVQNALARGEVAEVAGDKTPSRDVDTDDYQIVFYYTGFMPCAYNMFLDKPVDSSSGVSFSSKITQLNETEASIGFDYVLINGKDASVTTQIAIYNKDGKQISLTDPISIPLMRSRHTILRGSFLMQEATKGLVINPEFDGEYNLIIL